MRQVYLSTKKIKENTFLLSIRILDNTREVFQSESEIESEYCQNVTDLIAVGQALNKYFERERFGELYIKNDVVFYLLKTSLPVRYNKDGETEYFFKCFEKKDSWFMKAQELLRKTQTVIKYDGLLFSYDKEVNRKNVRLRNEFNR